MGSSIFLDLLFFERNCPKVKNNSVFCKFFFGELIVSFVSEMMMIATPAYIGGWDWHHPDWVGHHPSVKEKTSLTPKFRMNEFGNCKNKFPPSNSSPHTIHRSTISSG
jgi:hypothetical protein